MRILLANVRGRTIVMAVVLVFPLSSYRPGLADESTKNSADAPAGGFKYTNRLAKEKSPYLLQHAHNPVDWYPWGTEAFNNAKKENKPIFLSIGYSTCHWCHVMERESFSDPAVAKLINDNFVPVKVDREERPDIDAVYMAFIEASTGSGGWPMTVFLTPDRKPFFGGTYFPPESTDGQPGLKELLPSVRQAWDKDHDKLLASADRVAAMLRAAATAQAPADTQPAASAVPGKPALDTAFYAFGHEFDAVHGGFGTAPKLPRPATLNFLFHYYARTGSKPARDMALQTLRAMAAGGIHDQIGGGFHRYSTDQRWFLPHFEKMLYDQAQLAESYLDAFQITHDPAYASTARDILDYVLRDMTGPDGQFYSAEDADSAVDPSHPADKNEGAFYVWTADQVREALGDSAAAVFDYRFGVEAKGNVARDPRGEFHGKSVLFDAHSVDEIARQFAKAPAEVEKILADARAKLLEARARRPRPARDDKTLVAWNGLAISAFARAGQVLHEPRYRQAAVRSAQFIRDRLYDAGTRTLSRSWREGRADVDGFLDDYACYIQGLIDVYEASLDFRWLALALELQHKQDELFGDFHDGSPGGYFSTTGTDASVLVRMKDAEDEAQPSGNSVAAMNLLRLSQMTDDKALRQEAERTIGAFAPLLVRSATAAPQLLSALAFSLDKPRQIVLAGKADAPETRAMLAEIHARYMPDKVILLADGGDGQQFLAARLPFLKDVAPIAGKTTAFVCQNYTCQLPTNDLGKLRELLDAAAEVPAGPTTGAAR
jgi:uncharacterized protein YyaL (SSP411 family)